MVPIDTGEARLTEDVYVKGATKLKELIDAGLISQTAFTASNDEAMAGGQSIGGFSIAPYSEHADVAAKYACLLAMELANGRYKYGEVLSSFTTDEGITQEEDFGPVAVQYAEDAKNFTSYTLFPWAYDHADSMAILGEEISKLMTGDYAVEDFIENTDSRITEMLEEAEAE